MTNFNLKESLVKNGKSMTKAVTKEMPKVAITYAAAIVVGTVATTAIEAAFARKTNKQISKILNK